MFDSSGVVWVGTIGGEISRFDLNGWTTFNTKDGVPYGEIYAMIVDARGNLWVCGGYSQMAGKGYTRYDGINWYAFTYPDRLTHNTVLAVAMDNRGNLWFGTDRGGVRKLGEIFDWIAYTIEDGLLHNRVDHIATDSRGNVWFGYYREHG